MLRRRNRGGSACRSPDDEFSAAFRPLLFGHLVWRGLQRKRDDGATDQDEDGADARLVRGTSESRVRRSRAGGDGSGAVGAAGWDGNAIRRLRVVGRSDILGLCWWGASARLSGDGKDGARAGRGGP